jgi:formamidopyrimidine-DNA glycosylase
LSKVIPKILTQAIEFNGTTIINFSYGNQVTGDFKQFLNVFGKQGNPCSRCSTTLKKIFVSQRGTHYCPKCQKI